MVSGVAPGAQVLPTKMTKRSASKVKHHQNSSRAPAPGPVLQSPGAGGAATRRPAALGFPGTRWAPRQTRRSISGAASVLGEGQL